jgi:hypothetical protein
MAELDGVRSPILEEDVAANRPNSEAIGRKIGQNINAILEDTPPIVFTGDGFFRSTQISNAIDGPVRVDREVSILSYKLSIDELALDTPDIVGVNVGVYDEDDLFIGNLFGTTTDRLLIDSSVNLSGVVIGRVVGGSNINDNTTGANSVQLGNLAITQLLPGYKLRCFIENASGNSKNFRFEIKAA